jgi:type I restriction enzyme M protein
VTIVADKPLGDSACQIVDKLNDKGVTDSWIRPAFAGFLLLRWVDHAEAEQEAMATFEGRLHQPLLPSALRWRNWGQLRRPQLMIERLRQLAQHLKSPRDDSAQPMGSWLHALAVWLSDVVQLRNFPDFHELVCWVNELPFETPHEQRAVLEAFDHMMRYTDDAVSGQYSSPSNIAALVAALANPAPGERVYDPCFGSGQFLVATWQQAERSRTERSRPGPLLEVAGIELNPEVFLIGLTRMLLAGIDTPHLALGDSLEREPPSSTIRQGFDVVVANPPLGVNTSRERGHYLQFTIRTGDTVGLFVQHALSQLKPRGRAVVAVPEGFLFRGGRERDLRRSLIEQGQVEAVVGLPAGTFLPYTGVKVDLLVLSKRGGASRVRMVDAAPFFEQRAGRKAPIIPAPIAQQLASEVRRPELRVVRELPLGTAEGSPGTGVMVRSVWEVSSEELAAAEWDLSPRRREKGGLDDLLASIQEALGEAGSVRSLSRVAQVYAGRHVRSTDLRNEPENKRLVGYIRIKDLVQGNVMHPTSWLVPAAGAIEHQWGFRLRPGDVLMSKSGTIGKTALVRDAAIGAVAGSGLYVLRPNEDHLDPGFLMAYLASPACQNWLKAQARGTVIQHLNRGVLDKLPVPLPPLQIQARAAAQFQEIGTDALAFLADTTGPVSESDRLATWLAELNSKTSLSSKTSGSVGVFETAQLLGQLESVAAMADDAQQWIEQQQITSQAARWLVPLLDALVSLRGIQQIPPGPSLLTILQKAERGVWGVLDRATGKFPIESQARAIAERLLVWVRAAIANLIEANDVRVSSDPGSLVAGSFAEIMVSVQNKGPLPLRDFHIETKPDWGDGHTPYLPEDGVMFLNLQGETPKEGSQFSLQLNWSAVNLADHPISGVVELAVQITEPELLSQTLSTELGGNPYVAGPPLLPQSGHEVFFGREGVIEQISRQIVTHGNVVLLEGNRRAGKTSILKHLEGRTAIPGWLAVYSSLQAPDGAEQTVGVPTPEVFREIAWNIATALTKLGVEVPLPNGHVIPAGKPALGVAKACREGIGSESPFADFREYLEIVLSILASLGLGLVLMLDEFDKLQEGIDNKVTSPQVPENIRYLIQTYPKLSAILTGSRRLKRLREEYWSALYGLGNSIPVTALDIESARRIVTEPVRGKLTYSNEAVERIVEVTARQPYLVQCLCNRVFEYAAKTKSRSITLSAVNDAATGLVRDNEHFATLWDYTAAGPKTGRRRRHLILLLCALSFKQGTQISFGTLHEQLAQAGVNVEDEALDTDLAYLRELELVDLSGEIGGNYYRLAIPLMADWIVRQQDAAVAASRARSESEEENA